MVNVLNFVHESLTKWHMQTVQTQIRLLLRVYTVCQSTDYFRKHLAKSVQNEMFEILEYLLYMFEQYMRNKLSKWGQVQSVHLV